MKIKNILIIFSLATCLTSCNNTTTESNTTSEDIEITCPFANYTSNPVCVTAPAYAPYLLEIEEQTASQLYDAFVSASWESVPSDTPSPDGESFAVFVYNGGQPFKLEFYGDYTVDYEHENITEKYKVDDKIYTMAHDIVNPDNL